MVQRFKVAFYPGDLITRTGDREIRFVSGGLPDYPGELACMMIVTISLFSCSNLVTICESSQYSYDRLCSNQVCISLIFYILVAM